MRDRIARATIGAVITHVVIELEGPLAVDLTMALPRLRGPALPGLPHHDHGFVPVDRYGDRIAALYGESTPRP